MAFSVWILVFQPKDVRMTGILCMSTMSRLQFFSEIKSQCQVQLRNLFYFTFQRGHTNQTCSLSKYGIRYCDSGIFCSRRSEIKYFRQKFVIFSKTLGHPKGCNSLSMFGQLNFFGLFLWQPTAHDLSTAVNQLC